jgi:DNA-binding beta-propeller fold protein YncE
MLIVLWAVTLVTMTASASAAPKTLWTRAPSCSDLSCHTAAGTTYVPRGIAANPVTGHLYVADQGNQRIQEFDAWGQFVKAWGWGVATGSSESQICTSATGCLEGIAGGGPGQFKNPQGITLDSSGDIYVFDLSNSRVQKFDPQGNFVLMFGGGVDKGPNHPGNLCTAAYLAENEICGAGEEGTAPGEFGDLGAGSFIAAAPGNRIYVGDEGRIQEFGLEGVYQGGFPDPASVLTGNTVHSLAVDSSGNVVVAFAKPGDFSASEEEIVKLSAAGTSVCTMSVPNPRALATDALGRIYVVNNKPKKRIGLYSEAEIIRYNSSCVEEIPFAFNFGDAPTIGEGYSSTGIATNAVTEAGDIGLYYSNGVAQRSFVRAYYPPPDKWPPPARPPSVKTQFAVSVTNSDAQLRAIINPHFWPDTSYSVEYGLEECSKGGCLATSFSQLAGEAVDEDVATATVGLESLLPNTTYHYRFVSQSSGGGPVRGEGGEVGTDGSEATFTTFPLAIPPKTDCPNQAFRVDFAAKLADCRAYELVSPIDKNGGDVASGSIIEGFGALTESAADGNRFTFSSLRSFGGAEGAPLLGQYLSTRTADGWRTGSISPPRVNPALYLTGIYGQYKGFSSDLCEGWLVQDSNFALAPDAPPNFPNLYRRDNCGGDPGYELLTTVAPPGFDSKAEFPNSEYVPAPRGHSADGTHTVFRAPAKLTTAACPTAGVYQIYESNGKGPLRLVSVLPNGKANCNHSAVGRSSGSPRGFNEDRVQHAVSEDGSRVFWTDSGEAGVEAYGDGPGRLFLRVNATEAQSKIAGGECTEAENACTLAVSAAADTSFEAADPGGDTAVYTADKELFRFDLASQASTSLATGVQNVIAVSEDTSRIYFFSTDILTGEQTNSEGEKAQAGTANLYLAHNDELVFVATLTSLEANPSHPGEEPSVLNAKPRDRSLTITPDGAHLAFTSLRPLTSYDNSDVVSASPDVEIFLYDANEGAAGKLRCISCNPSGARPAGRRVGGSPVDDSVAWAAARIPSWTEQLRPSRLLSADGAQFFFESFDALVPIDTNGKLDVYEWQRAVEPSACGQAGAQLYVASAGGCLSLISSGQSPEDSELFDVSEGGQDVYFATGASLLPQDPGLIDIYDARSGGGYRQAPPSQPSCEGEACQGPLAPPDSPTPASSVFEGAGNVNEAKKKQKAHRKKRSTKKAGKHKPRTKGSHNNRRPAR